MQDKSFYISFKKITRLFFCSPGIKKLNIMKKLIFIISLLLIFQKIDITYAQSGYQKHAATGLPVDSTSLYAMSGLFTNDFQIYECENGAVYSSTDGGYTLHRVDGIGQVFHTINKRRASGGTFPYSNSYHSKVTNTDSLWIAGGNGTVFFTSNSGTNWVQQTTGITGTIYGIDFPDNRNGWAADASGKVIHTTNGGANWVLQASLNITIFQIYFPDLLHGWVSGFGSVVKYTSNGGANWVDRSPVGRDPLGYIWSMKFNDQNNGWMAGTNFNSYSIFRTTNGGINWDTCYLNPAPSIVWGLSFVNAQTGYACAPGAIFKTTNGGVNWASQILPSGTPVLYDIQFANADTGFAVGQGGTILHTTNGGQPVGIHNITTELPDKFKLSQNFPNPFNPNTKIKFQITGSGNTKLTIFNSIGIEMEKIVNEKLMPGSYEVDFDGSKYSSGVYFYKLETAAFSETKKMMLLK